MFQRFISFAITAALILAGMPVFISAPAQARFPRGTAAASCPQATDNGCAAAPSNGSFKNASLLTSAQQSGQNSLLPTRAGGSLTLNIPGVDYGIGPDSTLTPQDPRTINDGVCAYVSANADVECFTGGPVVHEVLNNYDFSGAKIGKSPLVLYAATSAGVGVGSTLTVTNSYFYIPTSGKAIGFQGEFSITAKNIQCDGAIAVQNVSQMCFVSDGDSVGTTLDIEYSAFTNIGVGRVANGLQNVAFIFKYNYVNGLNTLDTGDHGELMLRNCSGGRAGCTSYDDYEGNFIVWDRETLTGGNGNNATIFPGDGASDGVTLSSVTFNNNIVVANMQTDNVSPAVDQSMFNARLSKMGNVTMSGNWIDASGAGGCSINGVKAGGNSVTASQTTTVVNVTSVSTSFNNLPIEAGWQFSRPSGYATRNITSFGTGFGGTGTYNVDGSSQSVGSDSNWTVVPGFTSFTAANNYLLNDPGHTGVPTAIGLSGPQFTATNCF